MSVFKTIETEVADFTEGSAPLHDGHDFNQFKLVRRIHLYDNHVYPGAVNGVKFDSQGNYMFWFDIITPRRDAGVKNVDFDTANISIDSDRRKDAYLNYVANLRLQQWMKETGEAAEINATVEQGEAWGNVVWKKVKNGKERSDLKNFFITNQAAETLDDTDVIERHTLTQTDLRAKENAWMNVDDVIRECKNLSFSTTVTDTPVETTSPRYELFERNGEISVADFKEAKKKKPLESDKDKWMQAKVIVAGVSKGSQGGKGQFVLYAEPLTAKGKPYKEYHRGPYKGRWWREGLVEILMDCQTRANEIGNGIARGLQWSEKTIFFSPDTLIANNVLTDMLSGDIIRARDLKQVETRMQGLDQLIADWNRNIELANELSNAREVVQGESMPSGTPFRLGGLLNMNANKLYEFIREKLGIAYTQVFEDWILPDFLTDLKAQDIVNLTGEGDDYRKFLEYIVECWYVKNLVAFGPHDPEFGNVLKQQQYQNLLRRDKLQLRLTKELFEGYKPYARVVITGENVNLDADLTTIGAFINLEADPVRRTALIEIAMRKKLKNIDVASLPKSPPQALLPQTASNRPAMPGYKSV